MNSVFLGFISPYVSSYSLKKKIMVALIFGGLGFRVFFVRVLG
jgi:hypothetical protein